MSGRQAIVTCYHGATNRLEARVSATAQAGRIYVKWVEGQGIDWNHNHAARMLAYKMGWPGHWHQGVLPGNSGFVYVDGNCQVVTGGKS